MTLAQQVHAGCIIVATNGSHFLVVQGESGVKYRLVNIDADWWLLDPEFEDEIAILNFIEVKEIDTIIAKKNISIRTEIPYVVQ